MSWDGDEIKRRVLESEIRRARRSFAQGCAMLCAFLLALFFLIFGSGCCMVDHDQLAHGAEVRRKAAADVLALLDADLIPEAFRAYAEREHDAWELVRARSGGAPVSSETRARIEARK